MFCFEGSAGHRDPPSFPHRRSAGRQLGDGGRVAAFRADGFVTVDRLVADDLLAPLHERFDRLFRGEFETGIEPDEVNWQEASGDPTLTRQLCNGWRADRLVAAVVMSPGFGEAIAGLAGWPGARIIQDNVLWKPPGARSVPGPAGCAPACVRRLTAPRMMV